MKNQGKEWIKGVDFREQRLKGFIQRYGVHESKGKMFYLYDKSGSEGGFDRVLCLGPNPNRKWIEDLGRYDQAEIPGMMTVKDFQGAFPVTYDQAIDIIRKTKEVNLSMVSVDEIEEMQKSKLNK